MKTPTQVLHQLRPDGYGDCQLATKLRALASEAQELAEAASQHLAAVYAPDTKGDLDEWAGHAPLQLETKQDSRGNYTLLSIRVRGADVSEHLQDGLWDEAEAFVATWADAHRRDAADMRAEQRLDTLRAA